MIVINAWELILCRVVMSSCVPNVPHISWHDLPYRTTTKKYRYFPSMVILQMLLLNFWIQTWFFNCQQYLCSFHSVFECSPNIHDQRKMLVLPNQPLYEILSTSDQHFVSFQPILCHPHTQMRITLFHDEQRDIPNLEFSPSHASVGFSQIAFPTIVLPKDDHADFFQEERLDLPYWTMILAICVVVDESKCLDTPRYCVCCLSIATWQSGDDIHDFCCRHLRCCWLLFCKYCMRSRIVFYNITSEYNSTAVFLVLRLQFSIFQMTDVHQWGKMNFCALRPFFIDHLWFASDCPTTESFQIFPFLVDCCLCFWIFMAWGMGINLCTLL